MNAPTTMPDNFQYAGERFADIQILRYRLNGFDALSLNQKKYVYYLAKAALCGRDITTDQFGRYNLRIRKMLECVYTEYAGNRQHGEFVALATYLKRVWFSNGIYHHYGCEKFQPEFSPDFLREALNTVDPVHLPLGEGETVEDLCQTLFPVIFDPLQLPKRVNKADGEDLVLTSACNYYEGVTQQEVEHYYSTLKDGQDQAPSYGLNSKLVKTVDGLQELIWRVGGLYGEAISQIVYWLEKAREVAENPQQ